MPEIRISKFSRAKIGVPDVPVKPVVEDQPETETEPYLAAKNTFETSNLTDNDDSLDALSNSNYTKAIEFKKQQDEFKKQSAQQAKEDEKEAKRREKEDAALLKQIEKDRKVNKRAPAQPKKAAADDDSIFNDTGSEILGRDKRVLLLKVRQYKNLFKDELKDFKLKKNATESELAAYLAEMEVIIDTGSVDAFLIDGIVNCIKVIEGVSSLTRNYNVTGLADILKNNPQFISLSKQLFIKYGCYSSVPPEYQMCLLVATTAWVCRSANKMKADQITTLLNQPMDKTILGAEK